MDEFSWEYVYEPESGLSIKADNFFFTDDWVYVRNESGHLSSMYLDTNYIKGDLHIWLRVETSHAGPYSIMSITKGDVIITPEGNFSLFKTDLPSFTVDEEFIYTTITPNFSIREETYPCRISIRTGEIEIQ